MADPTRINSPSRETGGADVALFQEAVDALRGGDKARARELLTGLIKDDQNNAEYWIWLSAAMETSKERVYCLQTALKLDPENATAKRGLILLGALPADETVQPFSMNRPRAWEEKLLLAHEKPRLKGWAAVRASPVLRLGIIVLIIGAIAGGIAFGFVIPAAERNANRPTSTPVGTRVTFTATVTAIGGRPPTQAVGTPGVESLAERFGVSYTATPLYAQLERSPETSDLLIPFDNAFAQGDWDAAIEALMNAIQASPDDVSVYYYLGETHRLKGDPGNAIGYYNEALTRDEAYGPAYVGLARTRLQLNPNDNVLPLLDDAVRLAPDFGEAYIERARVKIRDNDIQGAVSDLGEANELLSDSPLVFHYLAQARVREGDYELALIAAQRANELDLTHLPTYLLLGQIHAALENEEEALEALDLYLEYEPRDLAARLLVGRLQFGLGDYEETVQTMDEALSLNSGLGEAYLYRFLSNVELGMADAADEDLETILDLYPDSFEASLAVLRLHLLQERDDPALETFEQVLSRAETNEQEALAYYWGALLYEQLEEPDEAFEYWELLLDLPQDAMTAEMRETAEEHLGDLSTSTPTASSPTRTRTATPTRTPSPTRTPTPTPTP